MATAFGDDYQFFNPQDDFHGKVEDSGLDPENYRIIEKKSYQEETREYFDLADSSQELRLLLEILNIKKCEINDFTIATRIQKLHISEINDEISVSDFPKIMSNNLNLLKLKSRTLSNSYRELMFPCKEEQNPSEFNYFDLMQDEKEANLDSIHPMDIFLLIFFSCDKLYRQKFVIKVAKCQFSLPLIAFDPFIQKLTIYSFSFLKLFKECAYAGKRQFEFPIVDQAMNIVSAVRIGNVGMEKSKSKLLNDLLNVSHDYFFHRNCEGSVPTNRLLDQTIEIGWYLPSGKDDYFEEPVTYLNLRGDATHFDKQLTLLSLVSNVMLVFISPSHFNDKNIEILEKLFEKIYSRSDREHIPHLILIVESLGKGYDIRKLKNFTPKQSNLIKLGKNEADDITKIISGIKTGMKDSARKLCINDITVLAQKMHIISEETSEEYIQKISEEIHILINHELPDNTLQVDLAILKNKMLPLQGDSWKKIAENFRDFYRPTGDKQHDFQDKASRLKNIREQQLEYLKTNPSYSMQFILSRVREDSVKDFAIFWSIFQNELDKLSKRYIPILYEKYKEERDILFQENRKNPLLKQDELNKRLEMISQEISNSSFGIEHVFREFSQIYEVCMYFRGNPPLDEVIKSLRIDPSDLVMLASQLLLSGIQLEILDGDVSHIPTKWVSDILICVSFLIGPSKRFYIISVLGIQSSGKSTLLNTMFGLDFAVSAGKCTKGAFMHLINIEEDASKQLGYDYILIVDTEGLRVPELTAQESYLHDNEIATFAIGLADLTIINILGEHSNEIQDILQITIYALIRMRKANCNPKCVFVHQNATAINMEKKLAIITRKFVQLLDEITQTAAKKEKVSEIFQNFNSVIEFNPQEDIFYFPNLFRGDPPMAPINPGYSEAADKLRKFILSNSLKFSNSCLTLQNIALKIGNLWNSVMQEDFVFNYRNVQELNALYELDSAQSQWAAFFTQQLSEWVIEKAKSIRTKEGDDLHEFWEELRIQLRNLTNKIGIKEQVNIKVSFFQNHNSKEFLSEKREPESDEFFSSLREKEFGHSLSSLEEIYNKQKSLIAIQNIFKNAEDKLYTKIKDELKCRKKEFTNLTNDQISVVFDEKWEELTEDIPKQQEKKQINIRSELQVLLINSPLLHDVTLGDKDAMLSDFTNYIESCTLNPFIVDDNYIHNNQSIKLNIDTDCEMNRTTIQRKEKLTKLQCIVEQVNDECDQLVAEKCGINMYFSMRYFEWIIETVKNICEKENCAYMSNRFINDLIFYECCKRVIHFENLQEEYIQSVSVSIIIEGKRPEYKNYFISSWLGIADELIIALDLSSVLMGEISAAARDMQEKFMLDKFIETNSNWTIKSRLQIAVLMDLCQQENILEYILYIKDPVKYIELWLLNKIRYFYYEKENREAVLINFEKEVKNLIEYCTATAFDAMDSIGNGKKKDEHQVAWKDYFLKNILKKIPFKGNHEFYIFDNHTINDYKRFIDAFINYLMSFSVEFEPLTHCIEIRNQLVHIYIQCTETCMYCNELCMRSTGRHKHSCGTFHRPQCLKSENIQKFQYQDLTTDIIIEENPNKIRSITNIHLDLLGILQSIGDQDFGQEDEAYEVINKSSVWSETIPKFHLIESTLCIIPNGEDEFGNTKFDFRDCSALALERGEFNDRERHNQRGDDPGWNICAKDSKKSIYWKWVIFTFHQKLFIHDVKLPKHEMRTWQSITKGQVLQELEDLLQREWNNMIRVVPNSDFPISITSGFIKMFFKIFPFFKRRRS